MLVDIVIALFAIGSLYRGREIGFVRQLGSTAGFIGGLFLGAWLEQYTITFVHGQISRAFVTVLTTLGCAMLLLVVGEYLGVWIKRRVLHWRINTIDNIFGALLGVVTLLFSAWLIAAVLSPLPFRSLQTALRESRIIQALDRGLPPAPTIIADLGHLINPNGFPQVFIGNEPSPPANISIPPASALRAAVTRDQASVVKVEGQGCGGIVEGSGFVIGKDEVATNAHVVAGIQQPYVEDSNGSHRATAIWFDPNLDFAVLRVSNLAGSSLTISEGHASPGTPAAVLGYPGGGPFTADTATVLDEFLATGRNIYGQGTTTRNVYEIRANIIPGNSGGPLVTENGNVIGIVFAESTTYQHTGYALTTDKVITEIHQATEQNHAVGTGQCSE